VLESPHQESGNFHKDEGLELEVAQVCFDSEQIQDEEFLSKLSRFIADVWS